MSAVSIGDTVRRRPVSTNGRSSSVILGGMGMRRHLFGAAVFVLLACASAAAQQTTGTITGRVTDPQGAAIPGANITARSAATGFTRSETSDAGGIFRLSALPVGLYEVTAELA